ncbi:MAG: ABC transporter permease [Thermoleophilia bacterium]|nr:ABC transporter permease [Thermoleophilia bacterium]
MSKVLTETFLTALVAGGLLAGVPLLLAALGESISERAGVLNIGLEGMMLLGGYVGFSGALYSGFTWVGFAAGIGAGMFVAVFMAVLCVRLGLDQIVVGIALTLAAEGLTSLLHGAILTERPRLGAVELVTIPGLSGIPVLGRSVFSQHLVVYLTLGLVIFTWWLFRSTNAGLNLRAAGDKPSALDAAGVSVVATRTWAVLATGALGGLGGAYLAIVGAGTFEPFMTNGAGFIAIVIAMLARARPFWVVVGALLIGMSLQLQTALQVASIDVPIDVVNMLPFLAVIVVLLLFGRRAYLPAALGLPYVRGSR